ncbi:MAG: hypothetical protein ACK5LN_13115 [Propioniciclava sp.]
MTEFSDFLNPPDDTDDVLGDPPPLPDGLWERMISTAVAAPLGAGAELIPSNDPVGDDVESTDVAAADADVLDTDAGWDDPAVIDADVLDTGSFDGDGGDDADLGPAL